MCLGEVAHLHVYSRYGKHGDSVRIQVVAVSKNDGSWGASCPFDHNVRFLVGLVLGSTTAE
jgi:hypothetical protein